MGTDCWSFVARCFIGWAAAVAVFELMGRELSWAWVSLLATGVPLGLWTFDAMLRRRCSLPWAYAAAVAATVALGAVLKAVS